MWSSTAIRLILYYNNNWQVRCEYDGSTPILKTYTIGDDVLAQATDGGSPEYMLYDGHGSTRQLVSSSVGSQSIIDDFNRMDSYAGNNQDPQSLHKYLYVHCNPVNMIDPSGKSGTIAATMPTIGILVNLQALSAAAAITAGIYIVDRLADALAKRSIIIHVRDKTLVRLAKRFNMGTLLTPNSSKMYFTPVSFAPMNLINMAMFQGGIAGLIKMGAWDLKTQLGINAFIAGCPSAVAGIAADPSLGVPSREPVLIVSAPIGSIFASMFGGGIAVSYEYSGWHWLRFFSKSMVTLPGEYVQSGKYKLMPPVN